MFYLPKETVLNDDHSVYVIFVFVNVHYVLLNDGKSHFTPRHTFSTVLLNK